MYKNIIYLLFCFMCFVNAEAQQQNTANRLLNSIIHLKDSLLKDTGIKDPCKKNIGTFSNSLPAPNKISFDAKKINELIQAGNRFTNSFNNADAKNCSNQKINNLIDSTKQLIEVLKTVNKPTVNSARVKVIFADNSKNGITDWKLNIDSLDVAIGNSIKEITIRDSMGYVEVFLLHNSKNAIKIQPDDSSFKIVKGQNGFTIQLPNSGRGDTSAMLSSNLLTQQLKTFHSENKGLLISILLLFFLILTGVFLYARAYKNFSLLLTTISNLSKEPKADHYMEQIKNDPQPPLPVTPLVEEQSAPIIREANENLNDVSATDGYFVCEVMMTAGPRKKPMSDPNGDKDLGEDVCGFISNANEAFIWLLDGTSDDDPLRNPINNREYFSARLLAQSIGDRLRNKFTFTQNGLLSNRIKQAIEEVKTDWLQTINTLPDEEKTILKNKISNKIFPHCSTTALIARLQINGDLEAYRVGDSKMLLFSVSPDHEWSCVETPLTENRESGVDRIFFRLELKEDDSFNIVSNSNLEYDTTETNNINTMICFSDGIGVETEQLLKQEYKTDPVKAKREIMYQVQGTRDDKSICFVELKKNTINTPTDA